MRPIFSRRQFLALLVVCPALLSARARGSTNEPLVVNVSGAEQPITVSVTGSTPDLNGFANQAFAAHGRYLRAAAGTAQFDLRFTLAAPGQVHVDVRSRAGASVLSQSVTGTSDHNALFRAADLAVKATSTLNGFFASRLAFVSTRTGKEELYAGDLFLSEVTPVTTDGAAVLMPRWSPDGGRLIFTSYRSGFPDIYVADVASQRLDTFASLAGSNTGAHFSPDGRRVAFVATTKEGWREIYAGDAQGRGLTRLTRSDTGKTSPVWSPDGTRILFSGDPGPQLMLMPAAGGTPQRLDIDGLSTYAAEPDWCRADPDKIAFTVRTERKNYQVAVASLSGRTRARIVSGKVPAADAQEPVWLADGRHLVCTAKAANVRVLYLVDTVTGQATRLSQASYRESSQAGVWGP